MPVLLSVGHVVWDRVDGKDVLGGSVSYAALTARRLGWDAAVLTAASADFVGERDLPGVAVHARPSQNTTRFVNRYDASGLRQQYLLSRAEDVDVHALSHVTGGGLAANLARVLPPSVHARLDRASWTPPAVFSTIGALGNVPRADLERTLNMGVGFVGVLPSQSVDAASAHLEARGIRTWVMGEVQAASAAEEAAGEVVRGAKGVDGGSVELVGTHPAP